MVLDVKQKKIVGKKLIVEIDESMFTRRNLNKGSVLPDSWCSVAYAVKQRKSLCVFLKGSV